MSLKNLSITTVLILACSTAIANYPKKYSDLVGIAKENIRSQLKDPYSAQFESIYISKGNGKQPIVCGKVNAKNSYGGYIGGKRFYFIIADNQPVSEIESTSGSFHIIFEALCANKISQ